MRPTKAQAVFLRTLGSMPWRTVTPNRVIPVFMMGDMWHANHRTRKACHERGWIGYEDFMGEQLFRITDLGRKALEEASQ